jgi:hypothetical protein
MGITRSTYDEFDEIAAPGTPAAGKVRVYGKTGGNSLFLKNPAGNEIDLGSDASSSISETVTQTSHGFVAGDVLKRSSGSYAKAQANSIANAYAVGIVESSVDANTFVLVSTGRISGLSGLTDGAVYFLSASTAGLLTSTEPSTAGNRSKPMLVATGSTTGIVVNMRDVIVRDTLASFTALSNMPLAANFATLDLRNNHPVLDFDDTTEETAVFGGVVPHHYGGGGMTVILYWMATTATTGDVVWGAAFERDDEAGTDLDADSFATELTATETTPGTSGQVRTTEIAFTNAQIDGLLAGESFRVKIARKAAAGGDTLSGDAELLRVELKEVP